MVFRLVVAVYGDYFVCGGIDGGVVEFFLVVTGDVVFIGGRGVGKC